MINIKNNIEALLMECVLNEDRNTSKTIIDGLKGDKDISTLYLIVNNLKYPKNINEDAYSQFIEENIDFFKSTVDIDRLKMLSTKISKKPYDKLDESINYLLTKTKNPFSFIEYIDNFNVVFENIKTFNQQKFDKAEIDFVNENFSNPEKRQLEVSQEILNFLNEQLKDEQDHETKIMIYEAKESVYGKLLSDGNVQENLIELLILKEKLLE